MNGNHAGKWSVQINKRRFFLIVLLVSLVGSVGLTAYIYTNMGDEVALDRSITLMGQPKYLHPIASKGEAKLSKPLSVAVSGRNVYVTDSADGKLAVFTKRGSLVRSVPLLKDGTPYPVGIAIDDRDRLYITVETSGFFHIMVVDAYGRFQYRFPDDLAAAKGKQVVLNHPTGIFYRDGKLYVTDAGDHDVKVFSTDGKLLTRFGKPGNKPGELLFPHGITADDNSIFVVDSNNSRVQVFDKNGRFKYFFRPDKNEPLVIPRGIAIDSLGRVHVVDLAQQKVYVFAKDGRYLLSYGSGRGEKALSYPNGIAIDQRAGLIYVADCQNNRVAVYSE
ncbi:MAG: 6-bladed beta-propeller [Chloroflexi bacterium]|nr:6-bladed beta-propeller [Chloroflexota bacterium]